MICFVPVSWNHLMTPLMFVLIFVGLKDMLKLLPLPPPPAKQLHACILELYCQNHYVASVKLIWFYRPLISLLPIRRNPSSHCPVFKGSSLFARVLVMPGGSSKATPENSCKFGIWKQEFCLWTQSLNVLNPSFLFLPQLLHLEYGNVEYNKGMVL